MVPAAAQERGASPGGASSLGQLARGRARTEMAAGVTSPRLAQPAAAAAAASQQQHS